jgi:hypothetical protein
MYHQKEVYQQNTGKKKKKREAIRKAGSQSLVVHACDSSTPESKAEESQVLGQPGLHIHRETLPQKTKSWNVT